MTVIEMRALEIVCSSLPKIAAELKRIADALESKDSKEKGGEK